MHDIFFCVPARRKFLKSETTELGHIASLVTHYALAHPEKHFLLKTPSTGNFELPSGGEAGGPRVPGLWPATRSMELVEIPAGEGPVRTAITEPSGGGRERRRRCA